MSANHKFYLSHAAFNRTTINLGFELAIRSNIREHTSNLCTSLRAFHPEVEGHHNEVQGETLCSMCTGGDIVCLDGATFATTEHPQGFQYPPTTAQDTNTAHWKAR